MMESQEERHHRDDHSFRCAPTILPKLRKNKRLEKRWGQYYYETVKEAVFTPPPAPYVPAQPPAALHQDEDDCEPLYVCKQCGDSFRFLSSLEAHSSRRSWILGYWCQNCFVIKCSHSLGNQPPCFDCQTADRQRKVSLRAKGLRKGGKLGSIQIFYNQCQFFLHLNQHRTNIVDMADIMLMPMPSDVDQEHYAELERFCRIIMEHMFLTRTHIMDWLRLKQLGNKWWCLLKSRYENSEDPLADIVSVVSSGNKKSNKNSTRSAKQISSASPSVVSFTPSSVAYLSSCSAPATIASSIESVVSQSASSKNITAQMQLDSSEISASSSVIFIEPTEHIEGDNQPSTTADIAFVDCGSVARIDPPDIAIVLPPNDNLAVNSNGCIPSGSGGALNVQSTKTTPSQISFKQPENPLKLKKRQDNKVTSTRIPDTAVKNSDCVFEPKISVKKFAIEQNNSEPVIYCHKNYSRSKTQSTQAKKKSIPSKNLRVINPKPPLIQSLELTKTIGNSWNPVSQLSMSTSRPRILTVHSPKNADLSQIIGQLPPDVINGKKIVFIGHDTERFTILPKNDGPSSPGMIKIQSETENTKIVHAPLLQVPTMMVSNITNGQTTKTTAGMREINTSTDKIKSKPQPVYVNSKVIYRNGKKFIIRPTRKPAPVPVSIKTNNFKFHTVSKHINLSTFLSKSPESVIGHPAVTAKSIDSDSVNVRSPSTSSLLASALPSPLASSSPLPPAPIICDNLKGRSHAQLQQNDEIPKNLEIAGGNHHSSATESLPSTSLSTLPLHDFHDSGTVEYYTIEADAAGRAYIDFSKGKPRPIRMNKGLSWMQVAVNCKQQMLEHFRRLGEGRIMRQIQHLKDVNSEYSRIIGNDKDPRVLDNLKAIADLEDVLAEPLVSSDKDQDIIIGSIDDYIDEILANLEENSETSTCSTCNKPSKSKSDVVVSSEEFAGPPVYCRCQNYVCHICNQFQGNMSRFSAHLNFHMEQRPFNCPECFRKFSTFHRLETHVWTTCFNPLTRRWFKCRVCQVEGFLDIDSLTKHFMLAHSKLKLACPECGILLKSSTSFEKHHQEHHPNVAILHKPVKLMKCDVGNCIVRLGNYRLHMDDHPGVIKMLSYKCPLCPYLVKETARGRENIKSHLYDSHSKQMSELVSSEVLPVIQLAKQLDYNIKPTFLLERQTHYEQEMASGKKSRCNYEPNMEVAAMSRVILREKDSGKNIPDRTKCSDVQESSQGNTVAKTVDKSAHNSQSCNQTLDFVNATLTNHSLKDGIECSVWSINLDSPELSEAADSKIESPKIPIITQKTSNNYNNVMTEYSSSPKICDVRSVTPDSYAELSITEQVNTTAECIKAVPQPSSSSPKIEVLKGTIGMRALDQIYQIVQPACELKESPTKREEQMPTTKLSQVMVINPVDANVNLMELLQSKAPLSNSFIQLSDLTCSNERSLQRNAIDPLELITEISDKKTDTQQRNKSSKPIITSLYTLARPPMIQQCKEIMTDSTFLSKLSGSNEGHTIGSVLEKTNFQSTSVQRANSCVPQTGIDNIEPKNSFFTSNVGSSSLPHGTANYSDTNAEEIPKPPPLARIPRSVLEMSPSKFIVEIDSENEPCETKVFSPQSMPQPRRRRRRPWRIALNAPICPTELIVYRCHLCGELINTSWLVIENHFSSRHSQDYKLSIITPRLLRMSNEFIAEGYKEVLGPKKRKSDGFVPVTKRRKPWNPRKHVEIHSLGPGLCVQQESVQDGEGNFICKKCGKPCNDISSLRTHIGENHRIKDHYLVCLECGENFVVEPSLQMHLKAFHRIQDPQAYMDQNMAYIKEITETYSESKTSIANQCHVCMAVFENKLAVDKHLRVHGMAFLNRKRIEAQNAARNPQKKSKIEEPNGTLVTDNSVAKDDKLENCELAKTGPSDDTVRKS